MHTPLQCARISVCVLLCVSVCVCVNTSSTSDTNPLTARKTVPHLHLVRPFPHLTLRTHTAHTLRLCRGDRSSTYAGYISPQAVVAYVGVPMNAGMVVGATGQVSFDQQVSLYFPQ